MQREGGRANGVALMALFRVNCTIYTEKGCLHPCRPRFTRKFRVNGASNAFGKLRRWKTVSDGPRKAPRLPKRPPRGPQDGPGRPQEGTKTAQDGTKTPQDDPTRPQTAPRSSQDGPEMPQDGPKMLQDSLQMPRACKFCPNTDQDGVSHVTLVVPGFLSQARWRNLPQAPGYTNM